MLPQDIAGTVERVAAGVVGVAMLARGLANKRIAEHLGLSEHTVKFHVASILAKFGASTRTEAVTIGVRRGFVML